MNLIIGIIFSSLFISPFIFGEQPYRPTKENLQARECFQDSKFGLFIHWGPYSVLERGEWIMEKAEMTLQEYENQAVSKFNPTKFDPAEWVALAKEAGMKYITFTSRHHDGFAMWDTKQNDWNIVRGSPCKTDLLRLLANECQHQDMKLFLYYSHLDWHHDDYFPFGKSGRYSGRTSMGDFNKYLDYVDAQLTELLTGYGKIAGIWFDGFWDKPKADWRLKKTYALIHRLQPAALIGNNHHMNIFDGEDFQMFEKDLPGQCTQGFNQRSTEVSQLPLEMCETINNSWGYRARDKYFKSTKDLIHCLVKAAGNNANFLLNVGPRPDGTISPELVERLRGLGGWMKKYGGSIYGTRGGPLKPMPWGVTTQKGNKIYIHILQCEKGPLVIPYSGDVVQARIWPKGSKIKVEQKNNGLVLHIPEDHLDEIDTIVEIETKERMKDKG